MDRSRPAAVDDVVSVQADIDIVGAAAALNEFVAVVEVDRIMAAAEDRVVAVAAGDRVMAASRDEQVVAVRDLEQVVRPCHANVSAHPLSGKMAHDDLVCPPSVPACDHPARRLAVYAFHAQLSRRRRSACGARSGYLLRSGAAMGFKVWAP